MSDLVVGVAPLSHRSRRHEMPDFGGCTGTIERGASQEVKAEVGFGERGDMGGRQGGRQGR